MIYFGISIVIILIIIITVTSIFYILCKKNDKTPGSPLYSVFFWLLRIYFFRIKKPEYDISLLSEVKQPCIILANHESYYDFYYVWQIFKKYRPNVLINEYYSRLPFLRLFALHCGALSKKMYTKEMSTGIKILRMLKKGYPIILFPEGRLSPDGRTPRIAESGAGLYRRLNYDLALVGIEGAYNAHPKWRKRYYPTKVKVGVKRVIHPDELKRMKDGELEEIIINTLQNDASQFKYEKYNQKDKAEGLEGILFRCAFCKTKYKMLGKGNEFCCEACGKKLTFDSNYHFTEWPFSISGYYDAIYDAEKEELDKTTLCMEVTLKVFGENGHIIKKEDGECRMNKDTFTYHSADEEFDVSIKEFDGMAFSCKKEIEFYRGENLYFFYPKKDKVQVAEWAMFIDLCKDLRGES